MDTTLQEIFELMHRLGIGSNYKGFYPTAYAVWLCVQDPERLGAVTKWLYPEVAKKYKTNWKTVERNTRTVISIIWKTNPALLEELAQYPLIKRPCPGQFLSILSASILRGMDKPLPYGPV